MSSPPQVAGDSTWARHARSGEPARLGLGRGTALAALAGLWLIFWLANPRFLSAINLTNLALQSVALGIIAIGVVLVLLIREIDLSVAAVSGLGAATIAVLNVKHGWPSLWAVAAGLAMGLAIGAIHGVLTARLGIPSFIVTLGGLLTWQGALFFVLGDTGTVNLQDPALTGIAGTFLPPAMGWGLATLVVVGYGALVFGGFGRHVRDASAVRGSPDPAPRAETGRVLRRAMVRTLLVAAGAFGAVGVFNADRGTPLVVVLFLVLLGAFDVLINRTRFGRHARATGSNPDVASRAGIRVNRVRVMIFSLASSLAVIGGLVAASRLLAVNQSSGSTDLMLSAIAAAVIGGSSLFGGRGTVWAALTGSLVIGSLANGLDLLGWSPAARFLVTGAVLVLAVGLDTSSRRRRTTLRASAG